MATSQRHGRARNVTSYQYDSAEPLSTRTLYHKSRHYRRRSPTTSATIHRRDVQAATSPTTSTILSGRQTSITKGFGTPQASHHLVTTTTTAASTRDRRPQPHHHLPLRRGGPSHVHRRAEKGTRSPTAYDAAGNRISSADGNGKPATFQYRRRSVLVKTSIRQDLDTNSYDGAG